MMIVTISPTYRITIPKEIREKYDLKPGQKVYFEADGNVLSIRFEELDADKNTKFSKNQDV